MPVIHVSDRTLERLKANLTQLLDTPDALIALALDALDRSGKSPADTAPQIAKESKPFELQAVGRETLPQKSFRAPLLKALEDLGGSGSAKEICALLEPLLTPKLHKADYEQVSSGEPQWWNALCLERKELIGEGFVRDDSERGIWELSDKGRALISTSGQCAHVNPKLSRGLWKDDVADALEALDRGQGAPLSYIYKLVKTIRTKTGRSVPPNYEASIRETLESNSSDSDRFRGEDLFFMPKGKGRGIWGLRRLARGRS